MLLRATPSPVGTVAVGNTGDEQQDDADDHENEADREVQQQHHDEADEHECKSHLLLLSAALVPLASVESERRPLAGLGILRLLHGTQLANRDLLALLRLGSLAQLAPVGLLDADT